MYSTPDRGRIRGTPTAQIVRFCGVTLSGMSTYRFAEAAALLGVTDDTLRRWAESGRFNVSRTPDGRAGIDGADLARR